jgi:hypothetical protein
MASLWCHIAIQFDASIPLAEHEPPAEWAVAPAPTEIRNRW